MSQVEIGIAIGKSQGWISSVYSGKYADIRWCDGEALLRLHSEKLGAGDTAPQPHQEAV